MRHCEAEDGEQLDPTRKLTSLGKDQAKMMGKWLARQLEQPDIVIESNMKRSRQTAKRIAKQLGVDRVQAQNGAIDPDSTPERAIDEMIRVGKAAGAKSVIAVSHGPLVEEIMAHLVGGEASQFHFAHGSVAHWDDKMRLHWLVSPNTVARDEDERDAVTNDSMIEAALAVIEAAIIEAPGEYTYDEVEEKRWILGDGGQSGNCEDCEDNADLGWVGDDDLYETPMGDADGPPGHPNAVFEGFSFWSYGCLQRMISAEYDGPAIALDTGKNCITIGPNHPLLTSRGFVPAKFLQIGDQLVYDAWPVRRPVAALAVMAESDLDNIARIEQVFDSVRVCFGLSRVSTSSHDFHGDVMVDEKKVDVVFPRGQLLMETDPSLLQRLGAIPFMRPDVEFPGKPDLRAFAEKFNRLFLTAPSSVSRADVSPFMHYRIHTIQDIRKGWFKGRAFDASTSSGMYCYGGFVVCNCECTIEYRTRRVRVPA